MVPGEVDVLLAHEPLVRAVACALLQGDSRVGLAPGHVYPIAATAWLPRGKSAKVDTRQWRSTVDQVRAGATDVVVPLGR